MRLAADIVMIVMVITALIFTFWPTAGRKVITVTDGFPTGPVIAGSYNEFMFEFIKHRDDCHDPEMSRKLIDLNTGQPWQVVESIPDVVQYPKSDERTTDRIKVNIGIPSAASGPNHVIMSEICYTCPSALMHTREEEICRAFSTRKFTVTPP